MNIAKTIAGVLAAVILLMAVALPIIDSLDEGASTRVYSENAVGEGAFKMAKAGSAPQTFTYVMGTDGSTLNGSPVAPGHLIVTDTLYMKIGDDNHLLVEAIHEGAPTLINCQTDGDTLVVSGNTWTITKTAVSEEGLTNASGTFSWIFYPSDTGTYLRTSAPVYVDDSGEIVSFGHTAAEGRAILKGTISRGMEVVMDYYKVTNISISSTDTDTGSNTLNSITFKAGSSTVTNTANLIVPLEYTSGFEKGIVNSLVGLIPVILVVALLVGIVYTALLRREE